MKLKFDFCQITMILIRIIECTSEYVVHKRACHSRSIKMNMQLSQIQRHCSRKPNDLYILSENFLYATIERCAPYLSSNKSHDIHFCDIDFIYMVESFLTDYYLFVDSVRRRKVFRQSKFHLLNAKLIASFACARTVRFFGAEKTKGGDCRMEKPKRDIERKRRPIQFIDHLLFGIVIQ